MRMYGSSVLYNAVVKGPCVAEALLQIAVQVSVTPDDQKWSDRRCATGQRSR
jgi:hypothetical protein